MNKNCFNKSNKVLEIIKFKLREKGFKNNFV